MRVFMEIGLPGQKLETQKRGKGVENPNSYLTEQLF